MSFDAMAAWKFAMPIFFDSGSNCINVTSGNEMEGKWFRKQKVGARDSLKTVEFKLYRHYIKKKGACQS